MTVPFTGCMTKPDAGAPSNHWLPDQTAYRMSPDHGPIWAILYDCTPGGKKNADGSRSYSLRFPALILSEYVANPEAAAKSIAAELNSHGDLLAALRAMREAIRSLPDVDPFSHGPLATADSLAEAAIAKAEGRADV